MLRILLSLTIVFHSATAMSAGPGKIYTPVFQRRAMAKVVSQFTSSLSHEERRKLYDANLAVGRARTDGEKSALLNTLAIELVEATGQFARSARANQITEAREKLREMMISIVRAAGTNLVFTKEENGLAGGMFYFSVVMGMFGTFMASAVGHVALGFDALSPIAHATGPGAIGLLLGSVVWLPFGFRIPGTTKLAHAVGLSDSMDDFWKKVGEWMKSDPLFEGTEIKTAEDFRKFVEGELRGISLDQACSGALLMAPREEEMRE